MTNLDGSDGATMSHDPARSAGSRNILPMRGMYLSFGLPSTELLRHEALMMRNRKPE